MSSFDNFSVCHCQYMQSYLAEPPARANTEPLESIKSTNKYLYSHTAHQFCKCHLYGLNVMQIFNVFADSVNAVLQWLISE